MTRRSLAAAVAALSLALGATDLSAQALGTGPLIQSYTFDDPVAAGTETIKLTSFPMSAGLPLGDRVVLTLGTAWASGTASGPNGGSASLSGLTDLDLGLSFAIGEWLVLGADATLPTGKSTLTTEESLVAGAVAADLLPFSISTWGSGSSFGGSFAAATQAGAWGVGFASSYRLASEFEPIPGQQLGFNPGDQLQLRVALDRNVSASTLAIVMGFEHYSNDQVLGVNLFQPGGRFTSLVSLAFPLGLRSSAQIYGGVNHRSSGTTLLSESVLAGAVDSPAQQLFTAGTTLRLPIGRRAALLPAVESLVFRASDGASQGWVTTMGTTLDLRVAGNSSGTRFVLAPTGRIRTGNVVIADGVESGLFGWEAGLVLRVER